MARCNLRQVVSTLKLVTASGNRCKMFAALLNGSTLMGSDDKVVGIIGGMGPDATVDFMSRVLRATPASTDQDHVRMVIENNPRIPSRQAAMAGKGQSPGPVMAAIGARLETMGAEFLVMPCNAAHAWQGDIEAATNIPFISIVEESVRSTVECGGDENAVGLLTTPGCFAAGLYQQALAAAGRQVVVQTPEELAETLSLVEQVKSGNQSPEVAAGLRTLADKLVDRGAKVLIAACTELPLVLDESMFDVAFISSTDVLARKTVAIASGEDELQ